MMGGMVSFLRYSVPSLMNWRGAGLGNEVIAWGKAFIGAEVLGLKLLHPAWALNQRGYRHDFGTSIFDWPAHRTLRGLPKVVIDSHAASTHDDYADVMRCLCETVHRKRGPLAVWHTSGMRGGYYGIRGARDFIRTTITQPRHVASDSYKISERLSHGKLTIALHIRAGDFQRVADGPKPGQFNAMLPIEWYAAVGKGLRSAFGNRVQFLIFTDDEANPAIVALSKDLKSIPLPTRDRPLLSDIHAMASADLLVCSVSSLSMLAAFISDKPYVWYGPHLGNQDGLLSIWGHEEGQMTGLTAANAAAHHDDPLVTRGTPAMHDGVLTDGLLTHLDAALAFKDQSRDLILYGVTR